MTILQAKKNASIKKTEKYYDYVRLILAVF